MSPSEANELRLVASETIRMLYEARKHTEIQILFGQCSVSLDRIDAKPKRKARAVLARHAGAGKGGAK